MTKATDALNDAYTSTAKTANDVIDEMRGDLTKIGSDPGISSDTAQRVVSMHAALVALRKVLPVAPANAQPGSAESGALPLAPADRETGITPDLGTRSYSSPKIDSGPQGAGGGEVDATSTTMGIATGNANTGPESKPAEGVQVV